MQRGRESKAIYLRWDDIEEVSIKLDCSTMMDDERIEAARIVMIVACNIDELDNWIKYRPSGGFLRVF